MTFQIRYVFVLRLCAVIGCGSNDGDKAPQSEALAIAEIVADTAEKCTAL